MSEKIISSGMRDGLRVATVERTYTESDDLRVLADLIGERDNITANLADAKTEFDVGMWQRAAAQCDERIAQQRKYAAMHTSTSA